jgi:hypothetical protein
MPTPDEDFFVGYLATPPKLSRFLRRVVPAILLVVVIAAGLIAARQRDPGNGEWDSQDRELEGTLVTQPYPMLLSRDGRTFVLVAEGKHAIELPATATDGAILRVQGTIIQRGLLRLLEATKFTAAGTNSSPAKIRVLSVESRTFRGEIIDPKCFAGAMKPGDGKTHKACAALCIRGGIPPAFVADTGEMFLLTGLPIEQVVSIVGEPVELNGIASAVGEIPILRVTQSPHVASK